MSGLRVSGEGSWCILRCAGASTLRLADSLSATGFQAWTPTETNRHRVHGGRRLKQTVPVMPTYAFARADRLPELLALSQAPVSAHPDFSVFRHCDRIPVIADATLDPLRVAERKRQPVDKLMRFGQGDVVRCGEAGFQGLSGVVQTVRGKKALVAFGTLMVEIEAMLLLPAEGGFPKAA